MKMKKTLALILAFAMIMSTLSFTAFAEGEGEGDFVAEVGGTGYASLQEALNAATDGQTVSLLDDVTEGQLVIGQKNSGKNITLDLGGFKYTCNVVPTADNTYVFAINVNSSVVTIMNGTVVTNSGAGGIEAAYPDSVLTLDDVTVDCNGTSECSDSKEWNSSAISAAAKGKIIVKSGNYSSEHGSGVIVKNTGGDVTINGGKFTTDCNADECAAARIDGTWGGDPITHLTINDGVFDGYWAFRSTGYVSDVTINGGEFNGMIDANYCTISIKGGTFNKTIVQSGGHQNKYSISGGTFIENVEQYKTSDDFYIEENDDGTYAVIAYAAEISGTKYKTLAEAFANAVKGDTITLVSDITVSEQITVKDNDILSDITLDGNGKTITHTGAGKVVAFGYNPGYWATGVKVKNLTIDGTNATASTALSFIGGESSTLTNVNIAGNYAYAVNFYGTHGGTLDNCDLVSMFTNGQATNPLYIKNSSIGNLVANEGATKDVKVYVNDDSTIEKLTVWNGNSTYMINSLDNVAAIEFADNTIPVAKVNGIVYSSLLAAIEAAQNGDTITVLSDISDENVTISGDVTLVASNKARTATTLTNVIFTVESGASLALDGFAVTGLSYIHAKKPESISVTNCDIDVTTVEPNGVGCPPAFIIFQSESGSVELTFTNNTLLNTPDETEDWYTYSHGIAGWNLIETATITGNTFGSAEAPLSAAAVKLMNFVEGATVDVSGNIFYVNSKDSTWGPNALQLYQNCSRDNKYTATISDNDFYVDDATAAIGINSAGKGNGYVNITSDNTVNGEAISASDVIVFGNGINDAPAQGGYIGVGVATDASGKITGGVFDKNSAGLESMLANGYAIETDVAGNLHVVEETLLVDEIKVEFALASKNEEEKVYNINLTAGGDIINRLNSADLTFLFTQIEGVNEYEIIASNSEVAITPVDNSKVRYEFHYNGKTEVKTDTNATITIGQVKFTGYGKFSFAVDANSDYNVAHATKLFDNIVDTFIPNGDVNAGEGVLDISDNTITDVEIAVPTRELAINITFPNKVDKNVAAYQDMTVTIVGGNVDQKIELGDGTETTYDVENDAYVITRDLPYNTTYTVTVSGAGYRTARYAVTLTENKTLNFWNNVMDNKLEVEVGKANSAVNHNFLAGDIVKDNNINIYDLSAVVAYFGTEGLDANNKPEYAKYDLNRDGVIDSKDVAYVLVSWNN